MSLTICLVGYSVGLAIATVVATCRAQRMTDIPEWNDLLLKLRPVRKDAILEHSRIDLFLGPKTRDEFYFRNMLNHFGGIDGILRMNDNVDVLVAIASLTRDLDAHLSAETVHSLRREGRSLRVATAKFRLLLWIKHDRFCQSTLSDAAAHYRAMVEKLLSCYQATHATRVPFLKQACSW